MQGMWCSLIVSPPPLSSPCSQIKTELLSQSSARISAAEEQLGALRGELQTKGAVEERLKEAEGKVQEGGREGERCQSRLS
jgi:hypothetical protein